MRLSGAGSARDQGQPFVLGEVLKVLHVQGRQRQAMYEAAGGDPGVIGWLGTAAALGIGRYPAPLPRDHRIGIEPDDAVKPVLQLLSATAPPASHGGPLP